MSKLFLRTARFKFKKFLERLNSRGHQVCKFIGKKLKNVFSNKKVQLPQEWFGKPTWWKIILVGKPTILLVNLMDPVFNVST